MDLIALYCQPGGDHRPKKQSERKLWFGNKNVCTSGEVCKSSSMNSSMLSSILREGVKTARPLLSSMWVRREVGVNCVGYVRCVQAQLDSVLVGSATWNAGRRRVEGWEEQVFGCPWAPAQIADAHVVGGYPVRRQWQVEEVVDVAHHQYVTVDQHRSLLPSVEELRRARMEARQATLHSSNPNAQSFVPSNLSAAALTQLLSPTGYMYSTCNPVARSEAQ